MAALPAFFESGKSVPALCTAREGRGDFAGKRACLKKKRGGRRLCQPPAGDFAGEGVFLPQAPSKEGFLGVEGIDASVLRELFIPFSDEKQAEPDAPRKGQIKKVLLFEYGLSGGKESGKLRAEFAAEIGMPQNISANALLEAANALYSKEEFVKIIENFCRKRAKNRQ